MPQFASKGSALPRETRGDAIAHRFGLSGDRTVERNSLDVEDRTVVSPQPGDGGDPGDRLADSNGALRSAPLDGQVHLWLASLQRFIEQPRAVAGCMRLLSPEESARNARYRREEDRLRDILARALVRTVLSVYAPVLPADWHFERDVHGRPHAVEPAFFPLQFSLSHRDDLVACVVAGQPVGVDAERVDPRAAVLDALHPRERRVPRLFFSYWTLREAYGKALGCGLSGLDETTWFELDGETGARLHRSVRVAGTIDLDNSTKAGAVQTGWWFHRLIPAAGYLLAVAMKADPDTAPRVVRQGAAPLPGWWHEPSPTEIPR